MLPYFATRFCNNSVRMSLDLELKRDEARWDWPAALTWWVLQCLLPTIRRLGLMAMVLLAISVVRQRLQMVASWLLLLWNWHVWCWPMTVTFVNCKHPCPWCWSMTSRTLWLLHCWRLLNIGSSNTLVADHTPWGLAALLLALSCSSSCAHMVPLCTKTVTVFCWLPWRACCPTLSPSWFAKRFHCAVVDWTQRRVRRSLNFKSIRLLSLLRFSPWFELTLKNCRVSFWASARLELWCEKLAINIFELQDFLHDRLVCELSGPRWRGRSRRFFWPFCAMWLPDILSPPRWYDFLFAATGCVQIFFHLVYFWGRYTGAPAAALLHWLSFCDIFARLLLYCISSFLRARHAHLWATTSSINQSTLRKIYGMPSNVTGKSPMIRYQWRFIAGKLLGGISKHVWWHVSEAFSPDSWWFFWSSNVINTAEGLDLDLPIPPIEVPDCTWSKTGLVRHPKDLD